MYGIRGMWEGLYDYFEQNDLHFMLAGEYYCNRNKIVPTTSPTDLH